MNPQGELEVENLPEDEATICTGDGWRFPVSKSFLAKKSIFFSVLFTFEKGILPQTFTVSNVRGQIMEFILDFIHNRDVFFQETNIVECIIAADYLMLDDLLHKCWTFSINAISLYNCVHLYVAASMLEKSAVKEYCQHFISFHFEDVIRCTKYGINDLPLNLLESILSADSLKVSHEKFIWRAIIQWIESHHEKRLQLVDRLVKFLRLSKDDCLLDIKYNPPCLENHLNSYMEKSLASQSENDINLEPRQPQTIVIFMKPIKTAKSPGKGFSGFTINATFDGTMYRWRKIGTRLNFWPNKMLVINDLAYLFNTLTGENASLNLITKQWVTIPSMKYKRSKYSLVQFKEYIYVIGGFTYFHSFPLCNGNRTVTERYNTKLNKWETISSNRCPIVNAVETGGLIYSFGICTSEDDAQVMLMEVYDSFTDTWTPLIPPILPRDNFAIIAFRRRIFILGGIHFEIGTLSNVDVFDPCKQLWEAFQDLPYGYDFPQATIFENSLVVYDDMNGSPPVYWNEQIQTWKRFYSSNFPFLQRQLFFYVKDKILIRKLWEENKKTKTKWKLCSKRKMLHPKYFI